MSSVSIWIGFTWNSKKNKPVMLIKRMFTVVMLSENVIQLRVGDQHVDMQIYF